MKRILAFFLLYPHLLFCQTHIYEEFGLNDGLPSNQVYDIYQAKNNVIWFATDRGIASYNGYEFKVFGVNDGILNNCVLDFYPQEDGNIYCSTLDNQLFYFKDEFDGFHKYEYSDTVQKYLKYYQTITSLFKDSLDNFHFGCESLYERFIIDKNGNSSSINNSINFEIGSAFYLYFPKTSEKINFCFKLNDLQQIHGYNAIQLQYVDAVDNEMFRSGNYDILKSSSSVLLYNRKDQKLTDLTSEKRPLCIYPISENELFIGYFFGGGEIFNYSENVSKSFLRNKSITRFLIDNEGGYWFTTLYSGVFYLKNPQIGSINNPINSPLNSLSRTSKDELLIGYENGSISKIINNTSEELIIEQNNNVGAVVEFNSVSRKNILFYKENMQLDMPADRTLVEDFYLTKISEPIDNIFFTCNSRSIYSFQAVDGKYLIKSIDLPFRARDACTFQKKIYISSQHGLYLLENDQPIALGNKSKYLNYRAEDIDLNIPKKEFYLATIGAGVVVYNTNIDTVYAITETEGLFNNIVNEIYIEDENNIWACTNSGLNKIHFNEDGTYKITGIRSRDGLPNDGITDIEIINDTVWIGSKKGLVFAPKSIFEGEISQKKYLLELKAVLVNDSSFIVNSLTELDYTQNRLDFIVETVSQKLGNTIQYKYKLKELEKDFRYSNDRQITYGSVPPGKYTFTVQAISKDGVELSDFLEIPILISPPFYSTWWFKLLGAIFAIGLIYLFFRIRILSYNKDITREMMRFILKKIKRKERYFVFKDGTRVKRIKSDSINYVKSDGNYLRIFTDDKSYLIRLKIGDFINLTPDYREFIRVHRSYVVRIDKVTSKSKQEVIVQGVKIPVSSTYEKALNNLIF